MVRRNITRHDRERGINLSGTQDVLIEENAIYAASRPVQTVLTTPWDGWSRAVVVRDNLLASTGAVRSNVPATPLEIVESRARVVGHLRICRGSGSAMLLLADL